MKTELAASLLLVQTAFFLGCGEQEAKIAPRQSPVTIRNETIPATNDFAHGHDGTSANEVVGTLKELDADFLTITNYVYADWAGAHDAALRMRDKIMSLPPGIGEKYARKMLDTIVSTPINHLGLYERIHALNAIRYMGGVVCWQGSRRADFCDTFIRLLTKCRDTIKYARQEKDDWHTRSFIISVSNNLNGDMLSYEKELAYRTSSKVPQWRHKYLEEEMSNDEYAVVKSKFEKFLGRPIRTYEEIIRSQRERDRQKALEEERRRGGPDVKVNVGDL